MSNALMVGLELPPALGRGKPRPEEVEPWLALVEELMGRGVRTPSQLRKILGVGYRTAERWMKEIQRRWTTGLSDDRINWRRESLYAEADAVARAAWMESRVAETPSEKASLFKVILMANQRKASLTGLDGFEIKVKKEVVTHTMVDLVSRVESEHGLAPGALEAIGRNAAQALSGGLKAPGFEKEGDVLDLTEGTSDSLGMEQEPDSRAQSGDARQGLSEEEPDERTDEENKAFSRPVEGGGRAYDAAQKSSLIHEGAYLTAEKSNKNEVPDE